MPVALRHQQATGATSIGDGARKYRVLYAEDQSSSRTVTTALLERLGYQVDAVEDGEEALERACANHYDVILLDIEMPVMDGVTAARLIRSGQGLCKNAPIVALSAFVADSTEHEHWRGAFDSALPKPANSNELRKAVANALAGRQGMVPHDIYRDLETVLPRGIWLRLAAKASEEMHALALTIAACQSADDETAAANATKTLQALAQNFGARAVSQWCVSPQGDSARKSADLLALIRAWVPR
jgi:CheY-like chemotaxis protein